MSIAPNILMEIVKNVAKKFDAHVDAGIGNARVRINPYVDPQKQWLKETLMTINVENGYKLTNSQIAIAVDVIMSDQKLWQEVTSLIQQCLEVNLEKIKEDAKMQECFSE